MIQTMPRTLVIPIRLSEEEADQIETNRKKAGFKKRAAYMREAALYPKSVASEMK